ncbi:MAG: flavodoxin family protein [Coriobacteriales bacterium]|nr:flavodoxin family protein [Coriobacteriales bacterium]
MKALLINGSPNERRCTFTALEQVAKGLEENGVEAEIRWLGREAVRPCLGCGACGETQRCVFGDEDGVNDLIDSIAAADALVIGSPVYYAGINGSLKAALDRAFFAAGSRFAFKPGGTVVSARRAGTTAALEQLNKYFTISQMPIVGSLYWPMVHGTSADEVLQDAEGVLVAYQLGANTAWLLKCIAAGREAGFEPTQPEQRARTNFIR